MTKDGCSFWRIFTKRSNLWYTWVVVDLCPKQAARWKFSVKIEEQGMSLETRQNVSPIDSNVDQILESGASWLWPRQHSKT